VGEELEEICENKERSSISLECLRKIPEHFCQDRRSRSQDWTMEVPDAMQERPSPDRDVNGLRRNVQI
jgi:hypothetical protein